MSCGEPNRAISGGFCASAKSGMTFFNGRTMRIDIVACASDSMSQACRRVHYVTEKEQPPQKPDQDYMWRCLSTKFACWEYECEWRVFVTLEDGVWNECASRNLYFANFGNELRIRHVILGALNETPAREIFDLVADEVRVSRVRLADANFDLTLTDCVRV